MEILKNHLIFEEFDRIHMHILDCAYAKLDREWQSELQTSPFTRVYCVQSGEGELLCNGTVVRMTAGNLYLVPSEYPFSYHCDSSMNKLYFHVQLLRTSHYDLLSTLQQCVILTDRQEQIDRAVNTFFRSDVVSAIELRAWLSEILSEAIRQTAVSLGRITAYSPLIASAIAEIDRHCNAKFTAAALSERLSVSMSCLQKRFRREVGISLGKYINDRVLFAAEAMLRTQKCSVQETAETLGFCDQFYFSRKFHARYGVPPSYYLRQKIV